MTAAVAGRKARHDPWKTAFFVVAAVALVAGVAWALLGSSLFVVRSVRVTGSRDVSRAQVLKAAGITIGTPLVRIDTSAIAHRVEGITLVQSARVRRLWPDGVEISTVPRTPVFDVKAGRYYAVIDRYGVVLRRHLPLPLLSLVLLRSAPAPAARLRGNRAVLAAGTVVRDLPRWLRNRLNAVEAAAPSRVILILRDGATIVWGGTGRTQAKAREVSVLLRTKATYYDVSDPSSATTGWPGGD
jgi:cell division protein FtsQ